MSARRRLKFPPGEGVVVATVTPTTMRRFNRQYRRRDHPTNVLSFRYPRLPIGQTPDEVGGEVFLCPVVIRREARQQRRPYRSYLRFLLHHGLMHLRGYDHRTLAETQRWTRIERRLL